MRAFVCVHTQKRLHKSHLFHFGHSHIFFYGYSIMSTKPTDKFRQTIIVISALFVRLSSAVFDVVCWYSIQVLSQERHTQTNHLCLLLLLYSVVEAEAAATSAISQTNNTETIQILSVEFGLDTFPFSRKFRRSRQLWNEEIFLFSLSMACFTPVCVMLRIASVGTSFLQNVHSFYGDATVHDCTMHVRACVCMLECLPFANFYDCSLSNTLRM